MTARTSIVKALAEKFKSIDGSTGYKSNIFGNAFPKLKYWDEVSDFPSIYVSSGHETREYHPANFKWGYIPISIKCYTKGEDSEQLLEDLLDDVEKVIAANEVLVYDTTHNYTTTEMLINSISTDEGLLSPTGIGEVILTVRYQVM